MDSFATAISLSLQHGVPLKLLCDKFSRTRFEPSGFTGNPDIPRASSIMDYLFRWLAHKFLKEEQNPAVLATQVQPKVEIKVETASPSNGKANGGNGGAHRPLLVAIAAETDAPTCHECGTIMVRSGACHKCPNCGATSGCS
jgi:ribonucleoside-diphosphate reductase alpha chain